MSAATAKGLLLLVGSLCAAPFTLAYTLPLPEQASTSVATRYLAFDDPARDDIPARKIAAKRKWKHAFIAERIREENNASSSPASSSPSKSSKSSLLSSSSSLRGSWRREPDLMFIPEN
ncbi:Hypothetical predicted protein [Lecanosticta acicola]|uniref:Uncharacterized protein n=1 Tax=Lecanosticta acicola TaxID=111012 RepID=A0AAI9E920_9PEZI|nr:Hypothetical predicted protein [Lecanosticta acicola]